MTETNDLDAQLFAQMREDFLTESGEILRRLAPLLVQLEKDQDPDTINTLFREVHTLKGTAGFAGFESIRSLAHKMEDVFGALRAEQLSVTPELIDLAFAGVAPLTAMREDVLNGGDGEMDIAPLVSRLEAALRGETPTPLSASESLLKTPAAPALTSTEATLRVDLETLDTLMELVGELITARNTLSSIAERLQDEELVDNTSAIGRLTRELQTTVTAVRMVPVERLFNRFSGVVRNMARERGKQVRLVIEGGATPLDRAISEHMYDPLVHLLRNAVDHGLEPMVDRRRAGKPEEGSIHLSAERRGDDVILRVADDGGGINADRVRRVAVERGLHSAEEAATLSDEQAIHLIFAAGFSTADAVTDTSGRGVGLDVVVQNVHRLRGSVSVETAPGQGTTFIIYLPLTLAILQVQLVRVGGYTYALPLHLVRETLQIASDAIHTMQGGEVVFIRDTALPLRRLRDWLSHGDGVAEGKIARPLFPAPDASGRKDSNDHKPAVVVRRTGRDEVLIVDELVGKQQVVIKALSPYLGTVRGVEGAAILPDGSVTLILDVEGLVN